MSEHDTMSTASDLLGLAPERAAFEAWIATQPGHPFAGVYTTLMRKAWNAAVSAERERCAALAPAPAAEIQRLRTPLTAQQLDKLIEAHVGGAELADGEYSAMVLFAAAVERAHGIGAAAETDS